MVDCRHCLWAKTSNYRTARVLHLRGISSHIWACTWNLAYTEYTHKLSMLEAGGCDLSKGFLLWPLCETVWRSVEGLASLRLLSEKARNTCFPVAQQLASPPASIFLTIPSSPPAEDYKQKLLYQSTKALCMSYSSRFLSLFKMWVYHLFCPLLFNVTDLAVAHPSADRTAGSQLREKLIQFHHSEKITEICVVNL